MQEANFTVNQSSSPRDCTIFTFPVDWHHELGPKLAVFPRSIPLLGQVFWPDLLSLVEGRQSRHMAYYTLAPGIWSVHVGFDEQQRAWSLAVFSDACLVAESSGKSLAAASQELMERLR